MPVGRLATSRSPPKRRGYGNAWAVFHNANASILHTVDAQDFDEANQVAVQTLGAIGATGDLLVGSGSHTLAKLARGAANTTLQVVGTTLAYVGFGSAESQPVGGANLDGGRAAVPGSDQGHLWRKQRSTAARTS